jgi:hypothetical protein
MDGEGVLALWESVHGKLSDRQRCSFLLHEELLTIAVLPDRAIVSAIARSSRLARFTELARKEAWWYEGNPCDDDNLPWCSDASPTRIPRSL